MQLLSIALQETSINPASDHARRIDFSQMPGWLRADLPSDAVDAFLPFALAYLHIRLHMSCTEEESEFQHSLGCSSPVQSPSKQADKQASFCTRSATSEPWRRGITSFAAVSRAATHHDGSLTQYSYMPSSDQLRLHGPKRLPRQRGGRMPRNPSHWNCLLVERRCEVSSAAKRASSRLSGSWRQE